MKQRKGRNKTMEKKLTNTQKFNKVLQELDDSEGYDFSVVIEKMGGAEVLSGMMHNMTEIHKRLDAARPSLKEQHPNKWVAWGEDGVVAVADSHKELLAIIRPMGLGTWDVATGYLNTEPEVYII